MDFTKMKLNQTVVVVKNHVRNVNQLKMTVVCANLVFKRAVQNALNFPALPVCLCVLVVIRKKNYAEVNA
jgi:hypothetical protein